MKLRRSGPFKVDYRKLPHVIQRRAEKALPQQLGEGQAEWLCVCEH